MSEPTRDELLAEREALWRFIESAWDIEPRAYFEQEAPRNGFTYPLVQAAHHTWKRDPRVAALTAQLAEAQRERDEAVSAKDFHAARAQRLQDAVIAAQAEATALREALAQAVPVLVANRPPDGQVLYEPVRKAINTLAALLGGQPPTGGQP